MDDLPFGVTNAHFQADLAGPSSADLGIGAEGLSKRIPYSNDFKAKLKAQARQTLECCDRFVNKFNSLEVILAAFDRGEGYNSRSKETMVMMAAGHVLSGNFVRAKELIEEGIRPGSPDIRKETGRKILAEIEKRTQNL